MKRCLLFLLILLSVDTFGQERFIQLNGGIGLGTSLEFGGSIGVEFKLKTINSTTFSAEYNSYKFRGFANTTPIISSFEYVSIMANWYPFDNVKRPYALLHLAAGLTYYAFSYNSNLFSAGPGIRLAIGYRFLFKKRFYIGTVLDITAIYEVVDIEYTRLRIDGWVPTITFGIRLY
jgi:hypothetical protein